MSLSLIALALLLFLTRRDLRKAQSIFDGEIAALRAGIATVRASIESLRAEDAGQRYAQLLAREQSRNDLLTDCLLRLNSFDGLSSQKAEADVDSLDTSPDAWRAMAESDAYEPSMMQTQLAAEVEQEAERERIEFAVERAERERLEVEEMRVVPEA